MYKKITAVVALFFLMDINESISSDESDLKSSGPSKITRVVTGDSAQSQERTERRAARKAERTQQEKSIPSLSQSKRSQPKSKVNTNTSPVTSILQTSDYSQVEVGEKSQKKSRTVDSSNSSGVDSPDEKKDKSELKEKEVNHEGSVSSSLSDEFSEEDDERANGTQDKQKKEPSTETVSRNDDIAKSDVKDEEASVQKKKKKKEIPEKSISKRLTLLDGIEDKSAQDDLKSELSTSISPPNQQGYLSYFCNRANYYGSLVVTSRETRYVKDRPHLTFGEMLHHLKTKYFFGEISDDVLSTKSIGDCAYAGAPFVLRTAQKQTLTSKVMGYINNVVSLLVCEVECGRYQINVSDSITSGKKLLEHERNKSLYEIYREKLREIDSVEDVGKFLEKFEITTTKTEPTAMLFQYVMDFMVCLDSVKDSFQYEFSDIIPRVKEIIGSSKSTKTIPLEEIIHYLLKNGDSTTKLTPEQMKEKVETWAGNERCLIDPRFGCFKPNNSLHTNTVITFGYLGFDERVGYTKFLRFVTYRLHEEVVDLLMIKEYLKLYHSYRENDFGTARK